MTNDLDYLRRRERQERGFAAAAATPAIARLHADMAEHFACQADAAAAFSPHRQLHTKEA